MPIRSILDHATDAHGRRGPEPFIGLLAGDAIYEVPSSPAGAMERVKGKAAVAELMDGTRHLLRAEQEPHRLYVDSDFEGVPFCSRIIENEPQRTLSHIAAHLFMHRRFMGRR